MEERMKYRIRDYGYDGEPDYIKITKDQLRLLNWLLDNHYLMEVKIEEVGDIEFKEI